MLLESALDEAAAAYSNRNSGRIASKHMATTRV